MKKRTGTNKSKIKSFDKKVKSRKSKPSQPTNKSFSISEWQNEFWSLDNSNFKDYKLFQSGIWFYERFKKLKENFYSIPQYQDTVENLIRYLVGAANYLADRESQYFHDVNLKKLEAPD